MRIGRREFLGAATCAIARLLPLQRCLGPSRGDATGAADSGFVAVTTEEVADHALLDLRRDCALPESVAGYEAALADAGIPFVKIVPDLLPPHSIWVALAHERTPRAPANRLLPRCRTLIVPACATVASEVVRKLCAWLDSGGCLLLEFGAGFVDRLAFGAHQKLLRSYFGLIIGTPIDLWSDPVAKGFDFPPKATPEYQTAPRRGVHCQRRLQRRGPPYVDYRWPIDAKIRDFSRVIPVSAPTEEVFGWVKEWPVALKRKVGKGTLIFLGSPLGPVLLAGDREARRWLWALLCGARIFCDNHREGSRFPTLLRTA